MKCIDCLFAMVDGQCLSKGAYTLLDADACESFRPVAGVQVKMLRAENAKLRELVRGLHIAHVGMVDRYKSSETGLIWEFSDSTERDIRNLESECEEECHRFDAAMRELGIEVDE